MLYINIKLKKKKCKKKKKIPYYALKARLGPAKSVRFRDGN